MFIEFKDDNSTMFDMVEEWNTKEADGINPLILDHYQLAEDSEYTPQEWKQFLQTPDVIAALKEDFNLMQNVKIRQLIDSASPESKSTGLAQIISVLDKSLEKDTSKKAGPAFIYCFVPLNEEERQASNTKIIKENPFIGENDGN